MVNHAYLAQELAGKHGLAVLFNDGNPLTRAHHELIKLKSRVNDQHIHDAAQ